MDDGSRISWLIVIFLLFGAMYFAVAETAFASVSRTRLKTVADHGDARAKKALYILDHMDKAITTILIGTNITHLAAASLVTVTVTRSFGISAVAVSTLLTTLAVFFFAEMLPKSIARKYSERFSLATAGSLAFFMMLLTPFSALLSWIGNKAAGLVKGEPEASVTEEELYDIIEDMTEAGTLDEEQGDLITSALSFGDVTVESILTSRIDMAAVDISMSHEEILAYIKEQNHSRLPVYKGTIDNIIGVLQVRKFIKNFIERGTAFSIKRMLDEPFFVHQSTKIDDLLPEMSRKKKNVAIVTDNYGGTLGLVTVEDILEELVGEIWDEDDQPEENIIPLSEGTYSVNPEEHVLDVLDELDLHYTEEEEKELLNKLMNELAFEAFTEIPRSGWTFYAYGMKVTILKMRQNRILRLKVQIPEPEETEQTDKHESSSRTDTGSRSGKGAE